MDKSLPGLLSKLFGFFLRKEYLKFSGKTTYEVLSSLTKNEELIKVLTGQYGDYGLGWWLKYNSDDYIVDYQYNNEFTNRLNFISGFDYEYKDPDTDRTTINDQGVSPITGVTGGEDIHEYRYGL